jgi:hypothetical protein
MGEFFVQVVATRRSTGTVRRSVHVVKYGVEGPNIQLDWFATKQSQGFDSDWTFSVMQITSFEYKAIDQQLKLKEVLA